jgi:hypothetical protein
MLVSQKKYCVFTSAGDYSNIFSWINQPRDEWDLICVFYGKDEEEARLLEEISDVFIRREGGKFQNLKEIWLRQPGLFTKYQYIGVCDDDIDFTVGDFNSVFQLASYFGFDLCQPAFSERGRISWTITKRQTNCVARIVNFVEETCPIFSVTALGQFLDVYDGKLPGWGLDWWFSTQIGKTGGRIAILDEYEVLNPHNWQRRGKRREIEHSFPAQERQTLWRNAQKAYNLNEFTHVERYAIRKTGMEFFFEPPPPE